MTDHVKDQLCARIEELEAEKLELNEQLDALQQERNDYQHQFARATEVLGEIHEALNGSGPAIVGMEAVQVRQLQGERDEIARDLAAEEYHHRATRRSEEALAAHVERMSKAALDAIHYLPGGEIKAELRDAYDATPETSLARLKAEWDKAELQPVWETLIKVADLLGIDAEEARSLPGKPSDVYAAYLARLKAQWQAEALGHVLAEVLTAVEADTVRAHLRNAMRKLRRQAEGGEV